MQKQQPLHISKTKQMCVSKNMHIEVLLNYGECLNLFIHIMGQQGNKNNEWNARPSHHYTLEYILKHK